MADDGYNIWTQVIAAGSGVAGGAFIRDILAWMRGAPRDKAETEKMLRDSVDAYIKTLISGYESRVQDLTAEAHALRNDVQQLRMENRKLQDGIASLRRAFDKEVRDSHPVLPKD
jgi:predicted RNase H-like nuclease (RuvC/YqgF family)